MTLETKSTKDVSSAYLKVLVHGPSGSGKTRLCATTGGTPLIISAEAGLLSLRDHDIDYVTVNTMQDMGEVYSKLLQDTKYDWICIDSLSEISETVLNAEMAKTTNGQRAYGEMANIMEQLVRDFRDLPKNVYMSCKQSKIKDEITGGVLFGPATAGKKLQEALPYFFDEVFAMHSYKDAEGHIHRVLQTQRDAQYDAKDRSGALEFFETPDLSTIKNKILNVEPKGE